MFSYQHGFRTSGFADVHKHTALTGRDTERGLAAAGAEIASLLFGGTGQHTLSMSGAPA